MPEAFTKAVSEGARVRTKKLPNGKYIHIAFKDGKSVAGEVHKKLGFRSNNAKR